MKAICRAIAFGFAVLAFVLLVVDGTTSIAGGALSITRVSDMVVRFGDAQTLVRWQKAVSGGLHPGAWRLIELIVLPLPAIIVALGAMAAFWRLGLRDAPDFDLRPRDRRADLQRAAGHRFAAMEKLLALCAGQAIRGADRPASGQANLSEGHISD